MLTHLLFSLSQPIKVASDSDLCRNVHNKGLFCTFEWLPERKVWTALLDHYYVRASCCASFLFYEEINQLILYKRASKGNVEIIMNYPYSAKEGKATKAKQDFFCLNLTLLIWGKVLFPISFFFRLTLPFPLTWLGRGKEITEPSPLILRWN